MLSDQLSALTDKGGSFQNQFIQRFFAVQLIQGKFNFVLSSDISWSYHLLLNQAMPYIKTQTYIGNQESKVRFRRGCLKYKNILFQNEQIQIGSKVTPIYDFYASEHFLQIQIFIGNKSNRAIDGFKLDYRATSDINIWIQQKNRLIKEKTQYKERIIVGCKNFQSQILLLMDFQCESVTIKNTAIPITLFNFCVFSQTPPILDNQTRNVKNTIASKFQYTEESEFTADTAIFKKEISKEMSKLFPNMSQLNQRQYYGVFTLRNLIEEYYIFVEIKQSNKLSVSLSSNEYSFFDIIFQNLRFLLSTPQ